MSYTISLLFQKERLCTFTEEPVRNIHAKKEKPLEIVEIVVQSQGLVILQT